MNEKLNELFQIGGRNGFEFTYKTKGEDNIVSINLEEKKISVNLPDIEDKNLNTILEDALKTLKESFQ